MQNISEGGSEAGSASMSPAKSREFLNDLATSMLRSFVILTKVTTTKKKLLSIQHF